MLGSATVVDITVDHSSTFVTRLGAVHNCNARGDIFDLVQALDEYPDYISTLKALAEKHHVPWPSRNGQDRPVDRHTELLDLATHYYESQLTPEALTYLETRGFSQAFIREWHIGYSPAGDGTGLRALFEQKHLTAAAQELGILDRSRRDVFRGRIVFPNRIGGHTVDLQGRLLALGAAHGKTGPPKYLNLPRPHHYLFNESGALQRYVILCEGIPDTLSVLRAGLPARGIYGTQGWRDEYQRRFRKYERIYVAMDLEAVETSIEIARQFGMRGYVLVPPTQADGKSEDAPARGDLNEWLCKTCGGNPDRFKTVLVDGMRDALTPWALQIGRLPAVPPTRLWELDHTLRPILADLAGFRPLFRDGHLALLTAKYGLPLESFRETCKELHAAIALEDGIE